MHSRLVLCLALALICCATAFPLSALFLVASYNNIDPYATQLLSLHDGTYLALMYSLRAVTDLKLNSRVRTVPFLSQVPFGRASTTTIVARLRPTNDSVIWAYAINDFFGGAYAVIDDARSIFVVGNAAYTRKGVAGGFHVLRFSVNGEAIWGELYTDKDLGLPGLQAAFSGAYLGRTPFVDLAGPRTLAIIGAGGVERPGLGRNAVFVDTITRKARQVRFPLPDDPREHIEFAGVAAESASGASCFADVTSVGFFSETRRLFVQCANAAGRGEAVSRVLVPFQANAEWDTPRVIMAGGGEEEAAVLYVVALRNLRRPTKRVPSNALTPSSRIADVKEMLLFKLDPTTLQDVEWDSGLISSKPTMRKLLMTTTSYNSYVISLRYICDRNTLVVLYQTSTILYGIETLPDGTIAFRGNSSRAAERGWGRQWLLYFGDDPEPGAVRIPDDPRPDGEQDEFDLLVVQDFEISEDRRNLYLLGRLETIGENRIGELITVPFPIPESAQPGAGRPEMGARSPEMEPGLEDGTDKSFEPSPDETAEAISDEKPEPSPNSLQEQYI